MRGKTVFAVASAALLAGCGTMEVNQAINAYNRCVEASNEAERRSLVVGASQSQSGNSIAKIVEANTKAERECDAAIVSSDQILEQRFANLPPSVRGTALSVRAFALDLRSDIGTGVHDDATVQDQKKIEDAISTALAAHQAGSAFIGANNLARLHAIDGRIDFRRARIAPDKSKTKEYVCSGIGVLNEAAQNTEDPALKIAFAMDQLRGLHFFKPKSEPAITRKTAQARVQACAVMDRSINALKSTSIPVSEAFDGAFNAEFLLTVAALGLSNTDFQDRASYERLCVQKVAADDQDAEATALRKSLKVKPVCEN